MHSRMNLSRKLKSLGYPLDTETGAYDRFSWPLGKGSLYVKENYISATGVARSLEDTVARTSSDSKDCPEWRGQALNPLLKELESVAETAFSHSGRPVNTLRHEEVHEDNSALRKPEIHANDELLNAYICNFYGYGSLSSPLWFVGMEEGVGTESLEDRLHAWEKLGKSATVDIREFHRLIKEPRWFSGNPQIQKTWKGPILAALAYFDMPNGREEVRRYQARKLATDDLALLELMPLPHKSISSWSHGNIFPTKSVYRESVAPERIAWFRRQVGERSPKAVVMYGTTPPYPDYWSSIAGTHFQTKDGWEYSKTEKTIYIICQHPVAYGVTDSYFHSIGNFLRDSCQ